MNYYKGLDKNRRKEIKNQFLKEKDSIIYQKANKIFIICIFGIVLSIFSFLFDFTYKASVINYVLDALLFIVSIIFLIRMKKAKDYQINKYALSIKKKN